MVIPEFTGHPMIVFPRLILAVAIALIAAENPASAGQSFFVSRPPSVLSPDLGAAWLTEAKPGGNDRNSGKIVYLSNGRNGGHTIDPQYLPRMVGYVGKEAPGTIVIDTNRRFLYLVLEGGKAKRYGVGVGRPGFEWAGTHTVTAKAEWPTWTPPEEMRQRQPDLPDAVDGGPDNPLGARALYLGDTLYRIHGSNEPWSIGHAVSSGCIRMRNEDVIDLYDRVGVGTKVVVI